MSSQGGYIAVLELDLHFPETHDLKTKRRELRSLKDLIHGRFRAAVAETGFQDKWQRAAMTVAMTSGSHHSLQQRAEDLERWLDARCGGAVSVRRHLLSVEELR